MKTLLTSLLLTFALFGNINSVLAADGVVASGTLKTAFRSAVTGDWKIVKANGKQFIELSDNFKAKKGPDVKIFLSPTAASSVSGSNATNGSVFIKLVKNFRGKSRIEIPANVDLSKYKSLVFHCEQYSKLWGTSAL